MHQPKVHARAHASYIMVLAVITNMFPAAMLWPVYTTIVVQKFVACTATDVTYTIMSVIDTAGNGKQQQQSIKFKDNMDEAAKTAGVSTCLTEDVQRSIEDVGVHIKDVRGGEQDMKDTNKITRIITDAISSTINTIIAAKVQWLYHVIDICFTWTADVIKGVMDIVQ